MGLASDFRITSFYPPAITAIGGKTYVVPGWHEVPAGTKLDEVYARWTKYIPKGPPEPDYKISETVTSSKGDKKYKVTFDGKFWSCECKGFGFQRRCKHVTTIKEKHNKQ